MTSRTVGFRDERAFLSNFYECPHGVDFDPDNDGVVMNFRTAEHAYAYAKVDPKDTQTRAQIRAARTPGEAKRLGRMGLMRMGWEEPGLQGKVATMLRILRAKFKDLVLASRLLCTGDERLVEHNWWHDNFWGSCMCTPCYTKRLTRVGRPTEGENWLGQLLMTVRAEIHGRWSEEEVKRGYK